MDLTRLPACFRDDAQRKAVQAIIQNGLTDDRLPEERSPLMGLRWQYDKSAPLVTSEQLRSAVSPQKLWYVAQLLAACSAGHPAIDAWIARYLNELPFIDDA